MSNLDKVVEFLRMHIKESSMIEWLKSVGLTALFMVAVAILVWILFLLPPKIALSISGALLFLCVYNLVHAFRKIKP